MAIARKGKPAIRFHNVHEIKNLTGRDSLKNFNFFKKYDGSSLPFLPSQSLYKSNTGIISDIICGIHFGVAPYKPSI